MNIGASLKSSDYYWPEPEPVALRATGQVSTLTELEQDPYSSLKIDKKKIWAVRGLTSVP